MTNWNPLPERKGNLIVTGERAVRGILRRAGEKLSLLPLARQREGRPCPSMPRFPGKPRVGARVRRPGGTSTSTFLINNSGDEPHRRGLRTQCGHQPPLPSRGEKRSRDLPRFERDGQHRVRRLNWNSCPTWLVCPTEGRCSILSAGRIIFPQRAPPTRVRKKEKVKKPNYGLRPGGGNLLAKYYIGFSLPTIEERGRATESPSLLLHGRERGASPRSNYATGEQLGTLV